MTRERETHVDRSDDSLAAVELPQDRINCVEQYELSIKITFRQVLHTHRPYC